MLDTSVAHFRPPITAASAARRTANAAVCVCAVCVGAARASISEVTGSRERKLSTETPRLLPLLFHRRRRVQQVACALTVFLKFVTLPAAQLRSPWLLRRTTKHPQRSPLTGVGFQEAAEGKESRGGTVQL
jgi:hypothetical protein